VAELGLRIIGIRHGDLYVPDPHSGSRLQPGYQGWFTKEGRAYIRVNSAGFRDRERSVQKRAGTYRIAVLGDSFAEALQVPIDKTFWSILEQKVTECARREKGVERVEVLNFGVSGHGTAQALQILRHYVGPYEPDAVLLAFYPGNDVQNNSQKLEPDQARPFFHLVDGELILDDSFLRHPTFQAAQRFHGIGQPASWKGRLLRGSRLLQLAREAVTRQPPPQFPEGNVLTEPGLDDQPYRVPESPEWEEAWEITDQLLTTLSQDVQALGAVFHVMIVSRGAQVHPDPDVPRQLQQRLGVSDLRYPEQRIESLGKTVSFGVLPLADKMAHYAQSNQVFLHGFANSVLGGGHWNEAGHRLVGQLAADYLCDDWTSDSDRDADRDAGP
jgi:hypothetical protein